MKAKSLTCSLFVLLLSLAAARADRGAIPFEAQVTIFEPNQRALIAWNGQDELLVLSTDLRASKRTKVLEVMPFPAEPKVTKGDVAVFKRAVKLINSKIQYRSFAMQRGELKAAATSESPPPAEITFHEKIGAHDVSVVRVVSGEGFVEWVNNYLKGASVSNPVIPGPLRSVVEEYIAEGFRWFAFDVVSLESRFRTTEALQYRFETPSVFYPVKISRANQGQTDIELLVLTPRLLGTFTGIPREDIRLEHPPVSLTSAEVRSIDKGMDELLGHREDVKLRIWRIEGDFAELNRDLLAR